ncbi:TPA: cell division protein FtsA [candidate division WOR-3 bacterium]|jgi:cell division protein FtsA|uniref:Cell division protein FtsA n=1 Tax=candidate division WOR-3 bacterium TaxID=2052148 RepID=A0A350HBV4_UNCW3|nr:cell division protein FtsA [candidate division WOR-3 bacterium]
MDITVLDIGTSSVKTLMASLDENGSINVNGFANTKNSGMAKSRIVDIDLTIIAIKESIQSAEIMAGRKADNLFVSIGGSDTIGISSKGIIATKHSGGAITPEDVVRVIAQAKVVLTIDSNILHVIPKEYTVDDQTNIKNPVGLLGSKLSAETMVIAVQNILIQNINNAVERSGFKVNELISQHVAAFHSTLDREEMDLGVALIDIGGGSTKISIFNEDAIRYIDTIDVAGDHITKDISIGLRLTKNDSESIKLKHGACLKDLVSNEETFSAPGLNERESRTISTSDLFEIIAPRVDEIIELVSKSIEKSNMFDKLNAGIVLTGGTANLRGIKERFERKTNLPVKIGTPQRLSGITDNLNNPSFAVSVGMLLYATEMFRQTGGSLSKKNLSFDGSINRFMNFFKDMFKL